MRPKCIVCNQELVMSIIKRRNNSYTGVCDKCKFNYAIRFNDDVTYEIVNIQYRFTHRNTKWHMTYRPGANETTFVTVQKQPEAIYSHGCKVEQPKTRQEKKLPGFVTATRFIKLIAFL